MAIPAKLQNDLKQFQRLQQDLGTMNQQRMQLELKLREVTHTLEELKTLPEDSAIYRPIGSLIVRAKDRKEVEELLGEEKETLEVRTKALERQENALKERFTNMQRDISAQIQAAGLGSPADSRAAARETE
ncbi:MAG: prefoldin subunit beta [Thermoplasmata archaeon]|nr:prefoldin subunit beta [Thermoplasmata archaeon]MCI4341654.1 prefoldin subunit beta [Thermoplasmata archaeon]